MFYSALLSPDVPASAREMVTEILTEINAVLARLRGRGFRGDSTAGVSSPKPSYSMPRALDELAGNLASLESMINHDDNFRYFCELPSGLRDASRALLQCGIEIANQESRQPHSEDVSGMPGPAPNIPNSEVRGLLLAVDDDPNNRDLLSRRLTTYGYDVLVASSGEQALVMVRALPIDLLLLDLVMPGMNGLAVLLALKSDPVLQQIPVLVISANDAVESAIECITHGAEDYISKPLNPTLLRARVQSVLERKFLHDREVRTTRDLQLALMEVHNERRRTEELLLNILPTSIANELRQNGSVKPIYVEDATIVFADFVGFSTLTENLSAGDLVRHIDFYFSAFDDVVARYGLEKLKTIGDCYMYVAGLPEPSSSHPIDSVLVGLEFLRLTHRFSHDEAVPLLMRVGVHTGPVIAGVVGKRKFSFDVWGETVNTSARIEAVGVPGEISVSQETYLRTKDYFLYTDRGRILTKEQRSLQIYATMGIQPPGNSLAIDLLDVPFSDRYYAAFGKRLPQAT